MVRKGKGEFVLVDVKQDIDRSFMLTGPAACFFHNVPNLFPIDEIDAES